MTALLAPTKPDTKGDIVIGVADVAVTDDPNARLVTYALGSCIGVTMYDPVAKVGGMLHFMLPNAKSSPDKAEARPAMFGDSGIPMLFDALLELGAKRDRLVVCAAGGAEIIADNGHFRVGSRNRTLLRKLFWKNNILMAGEDTGGTISRTLSLFMSNGSVSIRNKSEERTLWAA